MRFKHLTVIGLGLIGGSFALAARRYQLAERITALDSDEATLKQALDSGLIDGVDRAASADEPMEADLIYLSAPVGSILSFFQTRAASVRPGALVTDAGSTKRAICAAADSLPEGVSFVGGHPMAGSHYSGLAFAAQDLFAGAPYAIVPTARSSDESVNAAISLVKEIGARPVVLSPEEHDRAVSMVSHAPQLISTALTLAALGTVDAKAEAIAGSGFTGSIRLAASQWTVWKDICGTNGDEVSRALSLISKELDSLRLRIERGDFESVGESFVEASRLAKTFLETRNEKVR